MQGSSPANVGTSPSIDETGEDSPRGGRAATWLPPRTLGRATAAEFRSAPRGSEVLQQLGRTS